MSADTLFRISSSLALIGWILLLAFHKTLWIGKVLTGTIITIFALMYTGLIATNLGAFQADSFNSLNNIESLFRNRYALLAGWIHYLAFDLFTGIFIVNDARKNGIGFWPLLPCLFFTFMLGPFGLFLYIVLRWYQTRSYFIDAE